MIIHREKPHMRNSFQSLKTSKLRQDYGPQTARSKEPNTPRDKLNSKKSICIKCSPTSTLLRLKNYLSFSNKRRSSKSHRTKQQVKINSQYLEEAIRRAVCILRWRLGLKRAGLTLKQLPSKP